MTDQDLQRSDLLARRLAHVATVSTLNAEALRLTQASAGIEMDVLRIELAMQRSSSTAQLVQDLHEAEEKAGAVRIQQADCEKNIEAAEQKIEEIDRLLAAIDRN